MDAQEEQNQLLIKGFKPNKEEILKALVENSKSSSPETATQEIDLVKEVMEEYGFSREEALAEIEAFGG